jgi:hypothetical protein
MQQQLAAPQQQQQQQQQNSSTALPPAIQLPQQQHPQQQGSPQDPSPAPQQQQMAAAAASALAHMGLTLTPDALAAATAAATAAAAVASGSSAGKQTPAGTVQQQHGMGAGGLGDAAQQWAGLDLQSAAALAAAAGSGVGAGATTSAAAGCCPTSHGMPAARPCTAAAGIQGMVWNMNGAHQQQQPLPAGGLLLQPPPPGVAGLHMQVPVGPPGPFLRPAPESSSSSGAAAAAAAAAAAVGTTLAPEASQTGPVSRQMGTAAASAAMGNGSPEGCVGVTLGAEAEVEPEDDRNVCQVPGCGKDLSGLKEYHQRYKICDVHIRLPQVRAPGCVCVGGGGGVSVGGGCWQGTWDEVFVYFENQSTMLATGAPLWLPSCLAWCSWYHLLLQCIQHPVYGALRSLDFCIIKPHTIHTRCGCVVLNLNPRS